jgi:hypothetical protein
LKFFFKLIVFREIEGVGTDNPFLAGLILNTHGIKSDEKIKKAT